jgi:hypothetical protein
MHKGREKYWRNANQVHRTLIQVVREIIKCKSCFTATRTPKNRYNETSIFFVLWETSLLLFVASNSN